MRERTRNAASRMVDSNPIRAAGAHLALLRGINVGGKNILPMKALAAMFTESGCIDVRTYIQSGNVIFDAVLNIVESITAEIEKRFGMRIPVMLRSAEQMSVIAHNNPFMQVGTDENLLYVLFLADAPHPGNVKKLDPDRSPPDAFRVHNREVYLHLPNGAGRTKLTNSYFDAKLATTSTGRNWRTVLALAQLLDERCRPREIDSASAAQ